MCVNETTRKREQYSVIIHIYVELSHKPNQTKPPKLPRSFCFLLYLFFINIFSFFVFVQHFFCFVVVVVIIFICAVFNSLHSS